MGKIQDGTCEWEVKDFKQCGKDIEKLNTELDENKEGVEAEIAALQDSVKKLIPITLDGATLTPLISKAIGSGNITLSHPYTNYDALLIYHATDDQTYVYPQIISVSVFKHAIQFCKNNNKDRLNLSNTAGGAYWGINPKTSTTTSLVANGENSSILQIYGIKYNTK